MLLNSSYLWYLIPLGIKLTIDISKQTYNTIYYVTSYGIIPVGKWLLIK